MPNDIHIVCVRVLCFVFGNGIIYMSVMLFEWAVHFMSVCHVCACLNTKLCVCRMHVQRTGELS